MSYINTYSNVNLFFDVKLDAASHSGLFTEINTQRIKTTPHFFVFIAEIQINKLFPKLK